MYFIRPACICTVATAPCFALGEWPGGPHKEWFEHSEQNVDPKSQHCCGAADVVRTRFKVAMAGGEYPEDSWYAWLNDLWTTIPPEKIVEGHAPNGQPYLFMLAGTIQCFVRPKGGLLSRGKARHLPPRTILCSGDDPFAISIASSGS